MTAVSLIDMVPDKEWSTPTLMVSSDSAAVAGSCSAVGAGSSAAAVVAAGAVVGVADGELQAMTAVSSSAPRITLM